MNTRGAAKALARAFTSFRDDPEKTTRDRIDKFLSFELEEAQCPEHWKDLWKMSDAYARHMFESRKRGEHLKDDEDRSEVMLRIRRSFDRETIRVIKEELGEGFELSYSRCPPGGNLMVDFHRAWRKRNPDWKAQEDKRDKYAANPKFRWQDMEDYDDRRDNWKEMAADDPYQAMVGLPPEKVFPILRAITKKEMQRRAAEREQLS